MKLDKRLAKIGNSINTRGEQHGDDTVTAFDIPMSSVMLNEEELCEVMREPLAFRALFNSNDGGMAEPLFKFIKPIALAEKIEGATVIITHGVTNDSIKLAPVSIAKIKLEPMANGHTSMQCTIQCTPDLNDSVAKLLGRLNSVVEIEIDGGDFGKQQDLDLNGDKEKADVVTFDARTRKSRKAREPEGDAVDA